MSSRRSQRPDPRRQWRRWLLLFLVLAVLVGGAKTCTAITGRPNPLDIAFIRITTPVVGVIKSIGEGIVSLKDVFRIPALQRENSTLQAENDFLERRVAELEFAEQENQQLHELLELSSQPEFTPVTARVIARPYDLWLESVIINAGTSHGVRQGNLVVSGNGVIGLISEARGTYSRVQLISSPALAMGAVSEGEQIAGVIRGISAYRLKLDMVPAGSRVELGEKIYTRGVEAYEGAEDNRPRGVFIGVVMHIGTDRSGFMDIIVEPAASVNRLGNVVVYTR